MEIPELSAYMALMTERRELFMNSGPIRIETDINVIHDFMKKTGKKIGEIYRSDYNILLVDLVQEGRGPLHTYERLVPVANGGAVVVIPIFKGNFLMLRQFRHALRGEQLSFPRGYGETGISNADNVCKEIWEEIGSEVKSITCLGSVIADSGLSGNAVSVYIAEVTKPKQSGYDEGIQNIITVSESQLQQWIASQRITDGYTLAAYCLYLNRDGK